MNSATTAAATDVDRISQLPHEITHTILSLLPTIDLARVSVLSKAWNGFFNCFPMSDFSDPLADRSYYSLVGGFHKALPSYIDYNLDPERPLRMLKFVQKSLLSVCRQDSIMPRFRLSIVRHRCTPQIANLTDDCMQLAANYGVKELDLHLGFGYDLPLATFSGNELVVFRLSRCNIHLPPEASVDWPFLRELSLNQVEIHDKKVFDKIISTCPFVEKISLEDCSGLSKCLKLLGFTKLKEVAVKDCWMKRIEIDALSLQAFSFACELWNDYGIHLDLTACRNLEVLDLQYYSITGDNTIEDLIPRFPNLKVLILKADRSLSIRISSQQLEILQLYTDSMGSVIINAPRLQAFQLSFTEYEYTFFSLKKSNLEEVVVKLNSDGAEYYDILKNWTMSLRKFKQIKLLTLGVHYRGGISYVLSDISSNSSRPMFLDVHHLQLDVNIDSYDRDEIQSGKVYQSLVEDVLRMCHPKTLSFKSASGWGTNDEFVKLLCKKLMCSAERRQYCCAASGLKCWRYDLKGFQVEYSGGNRGKGTTTCEALLDSLPNFDIDKIRFLLEWY